MEKGGKYIDKREQQLHKISVPWENVAILGVLHGWLWQELREGHGVKKGRWTYGLESVHKGPVALQSLLGSLV